MANRFFSPDQQFADATGLPYAGGFLYFYTTGTSTPLNTYSDSTLTTPNLNPIVLDSAGRAGSVFLQNLPYKVVLNDVNNVQVWTEDPVWSSDYSTLAQVQPFAGNPNGNLAGFAGTQGALPGSSMVWDYTNDILYVATTTGNATTTVWTAVNSPTTSSVVPTPTGYLTLNSDPSNPIPPSDITAGTAVYYTPYTGSTLPIYTGTTFSSLAFTQLTLTLSASQAADTIYDVFAFSNSGVVTLVTGPAWSNSTAGSSVRGTGAGTTQIQRLNGIWVNAVQITGRNGASTFTIGANLATYVGTIYTDHTAGQVSCYRAVGQNRKWGVWNAYNRVPTIVSVNDATANWTYSTATIRASHNIPSSYSSIVFNAGSGTAANGASILVGLPEEQLNIVFSQMLRVDTSASSTIQGQSLVGINSTTAGSGKVGQMGLISASIGSQSDVFATYALPPALGLTNVVCLEDAISSAVVTYSGGSNMVMKISYLA